MIDSISTFKEGQLIYAANCDDFKYVSFWCKLDFLGIVGYFSLIPSNTPMVKDLVDAWQINISEINNFSTSQNKEVIFTKIGYKSVDQSASEPRNFG